MLTATLSALLALTTAATLSRSIEPEPEDFLEGNLFEGDIMLKNGESVYEKNALQNRRQLWPNGTIFYLFSPQFSAKAQALIRDAMSEYHRKTCIRFEEGKGHGNYLLFRSGSGCSSFLGMVGGEQALTLHLPNCIYKGIVMHELMHAVGFVHEQSRPDRDDFVNVNWENIAIAKRPNFMKFDYKLVDTLQINYDYMSIMHYSAWTFAVDKSRPSIIPKDSRVELSDLGKSWKKGVFTDKDVEKVNKLYKCSDKS